ncbi:MAG TPA: hypothetical protein VK922_03860 [Gemmatimonadaceae bacterium]|nr:hypothetical protein [Gemmatimonadaceae bacterium]
MNYTTRILLAVTAGTFVSACGGNSGEPADAMAGGAGEATGTMAPRDACAVLTESEVAAMTGEPVSERRGEGGTTYSECGWFGTQTETPYLELTVHWRGGRETWEVQRMGYGIARDMMRTAEGAELDSIVRPGPVPALGDSAIFAELMPAIVLDDDVMLEMYLFHLPDAALRFRPLAATILTRVKS